MSKHIPTKVVQELKVLDEITDNLGLPIDEEIKLLVATLRVLGFVTTSSCSGHSNRGTPYVEISSQTTLDFDESSRIQELITLMQQHPGDQIYENEYLELTKLPKLANLQDAWRLQQLLKSFYQTRTVSVETVLVIGNTGAGLGGYRLQPNCATFANVMGKQDRLEWLKDAQAEMSAFADFLTNEVKQL